jgi:hypothetical protein
MQRLYGDMATNSRFKATLGFGENTLITF